VPPPENPLATVHEDLDSLFCNVCKAPLPAHLSVCANCGARRGDSRAGGPPSQPGPTAPAATVQGFSGSGSRQVIAAPAPPPAAQLPAVPPSAPLAPAGSGGILSPITGFDDTGAAAPANADERSHATAPRSLPAPGETPAPRPGTAARGVAVPKPQGGTLEPAGFWIRLVAWFLDTFWMALLALGASFAAGGPTSQVGQWVAPAVYLGLSLLVPVIGWGLFGTTPAKRLLGLYVGPLLGGVGIGIGGALLRWVGTLLSMALLGIGFLMVGISKDKRGLHDHIAGTVVGRKR
jgi:uncharacterized RDD family membrane protein YckC